MTLEETALPYPESFVVRLLIWGLLAGWMAVQHILDVLILHDPFAIGPIDTIAPLAIGVAECFAWKPKEQ